MTTSSPLVTYQAALIQAGLSPEQAAIYEFLLKSGSKTAGSISLGTPYKRGLVYKILEGLVETGLVLKHDKPGAVAVFEPAHPLKLRELAEQKEARAKMAQEALTGVLDRLTVDYNLISGRPGVKLYEGKEGIVQLLADSLEAKTEILTLADIVAVERYIKDIDETYVGQRNRRKIPKRLLVLDTPEARRMLDRPEHFTADMRYCGLDINPFNTAILLYDNKVAYLTLTDKHILGFLIEDPYIYSTQKAMFEFIWRQSKPLAAAPTVSPVQSPSV